MDKFVVQIDYTPSNGRDNMLYGPFDSYELAKRFMDDQLHQMTADYAGSVRKLFDPRG